MKIMSLSYKMGDVLVLEPFFSLVDREELRRMLKQQTQADHIWWEDEIGGEYDPLHGPHAKEWRDEWEERKKTILTERPVYNLSTQIANLVWATKRHARKHTEATKADVEAARTVYHDEAERQLGRNTRKYHFLKEGVILASMQLSCRGTAEAMAKEIFGGCDIEVCTVEIGEKCKYQEDDTCNN